MKLDARLDATSDPIVSGPSVPRISRWLAPFSLAVVDVGVAVIGLLLGLYLRAAILPRLVEIGTFEPVRTYFSLWPVYGLVFVIKFMFGLYPGYGLNDADELRRQTWSTLLAAAFLLAGGAVFKFSGDYSRVVLAIEFSLMLFLGPIARWWTKLVLASLGLFGAAAWVVGTTERASELTDILNRAPTLGLRVVGRSPGLPPRNVRCPHCVFIPDELTDVWQVLDELNSRFQHVWLVPNLLDIASVWVTARDLRGHLALELRNNLLQPINQLGKRLFDLLFVFFFGPATLVMLVVLSVLIRLDTRGPVLYRHTRIGKGGRPLRVIKFRTMHVDADRRLECFLAGSPAALAEWRAKGKLRDDPRTTRVGRILRRYSLDELPQVWNILRGEMSLVGPRAITRSELGMYGGMKGLYTSVVPGLTGLWQVSGRNDLTYEQRSRLDAYYVRNWSIWLELMVIARTIGAVLRGRGAY